MTEHSHDLPLPSLLARRPVLTSVVIGALVLVPHAVLPPEASRGLAAVVIALIAGIYFGFAVVRGSGRDQCVEFGVACLFAVTGLVGLLRWPVLLPIAYVAHAGWDMAHDHRARLPLVTIPRWYPPWCVVIDVIVGAGLFVWWWRAGLL